MPASTTPGPRLTPRATWRVMVAMFALTIGTLLTAAHFWIGRALAIPLAPWVLGAGVILALPGTLARRQIVARTDAGRTVVHTSAARLITACSLTELPALVGAVYYALGREPYGTALLVGVSMVLLWRLRPPR